MLNEGEMAPEFTLETFDDGQISLSKMLEDGNNLCMVFLRHLG